VVPPSGKKLTYVNIPAKKHSASSAHTDWRGFQSRKRNHNGGKVEKNGYRVKKMVHEGDISLYRVVGGNGGSLLKYNAKGLNRKIPNKWRVNWPAFDTEAPAAQLIKNSYAF
jgi:hypothetical protein